ncbi:hypothetical protein V8E36_003481 [Tilletia maclaganii]
MELCLRGRERWLIQYLSPPLASGLSRPASLPPRCPSFLPDPQHLSADSKKARCGRLIQALSECHERGLYARMTGECNSIKNELNQCLRAERLERTQRNNASGRERREKKEQVWKEIDEDA